MSDPSPAAPPTLAVLGFSGPVMRYAEVAPGPRLVRLGACEFETNVEAALFRAAPVQAEAPDALAAVEDALRDVFAGTAARALVVAVPPTASTAFFTPLPAGLAPADRDGQIRQEAALLADIPPAVPVRVRAIPVRAEATPEGASGDAARLWYHVLHVPEAVHARLSRLAAALGVASYDVADAGRAVAAVVQALGTDAGDDAASLVVAAHGDHTEAVVVRGGAFAFAHHGPGTTPEDTAYYALAALDAAGLDAASVGRVFALGDPDGGRLDVLASLAGAEAVPLNPIGLFGQPVESATAWELAAFAPVLGAALAALPAAAAAV